MNISLVLNSGDISFFKVPKIFSCTRAYNPQKTAIFC